MSDDEIIQFFEEDDGVHSSAQDTSDSGGDLWEQSDMPDGMHVSEEFGNLRITSRGGPSSAGIPAGGSLMQALMQDMM